MSGNPAPSAPSADQVVISAADLAGLNTAPAAPAPVVSEEIAYLRQAGLDGTDALAVELEALMRSQPAPVPSPAPMTQPPAPTAPQTQPPAQTLQTPQEKALDPYAVDGGPKTETIEGDDVTSVVIDAEGRARDAQTGRYVPLKALHAERSKVKDLRAELETQRVMQARAEERLAVLNEFLSQSGGEEGAAKPGAKAEPQPEVEIDPEQDIFAAVRQLMAQNKQLKTQLDERTQQNQGQIQEIAQMQAIQRDVNSFYAKNPDMLKAYEHLRTTRDAALQALGFEDAGQRKDLLAKEEKALQSQAVKGGKSYAEIMYNLARAHGYQKSDPAPEPVTTPTQVAQPDAAPAPAPAAVAKVESIKQGQEANQTLNGHGGSPAEGLTMQQLANMPEGDFLNLAQKLGKGKLDQLLRGL